MARSVLAVDDSPFIRQAVCELFMREGDFSVCGEAADGREAIRKAQQLHPDLVVTDLSSPSRTVWRRQRLLRKLLPQVSVIIFTSHDDPFIEKEARSAGGLCFNSQIRYSSKSARPRQKLARSVLPCLSHRIEIPPFARAYGGWCGFFMPKSNSYLLQSRNFIPKLSRNYHCEFSN